MLPSHLLLVRQHFADRRVSDPGAETRRRMDESGFAERLRPGASVAIGVGSRGVANIAEIVKAVTGYWLDRGMKPFIFPAMGSHGAATPEGQADVLAHLGITYGAMACPVVSRPDVVALGATGDGVDVFMDAAAYAADAAMVVARVKWHTTFTGRIESGLMKMLSIGIGKFAGAQRYHSHSQRLGLEHVIRTAARRVLQSANIVGALAIVEDGHHNTAAIEAVAAADIEARDEANLALAKSWMPALPCGVDVLIVDRIGKNISGTGMDAKVVNRGPACEYNPMADLPSIVRIFVRELDPESYGNALGVGMADVTTDRLVRAIAWEPTRINALSSGFPCKIRLPVHFPSDRECLEWVAGTAGRIDPAQVTYGWIRDTLSLDRVALSPNLRAEVEGWPLLDIEAEIPVRWDECGNLVSPFAAAGRR